MPRTWKSALAPILAGIPERTGFAGEVRFGLLNDIRFGERKLPRMIDRCGALALPKGASVPTDWPQAGTGRAARRCARLARAAGLAGRRPPGGGASRPARSARASAGRSASYAELARALTRDGASIWVLGSPDEATFASEIVRAAGPAAHDLTSSDLRNAILALRLASACVSNNSGLVHVAAAIGTPTIGIFGPTSPWHWAPLNPLAAVIETATERACRPCHKPVCRLVITAACATSRRRRC